MCQKIIRNVFVLIFIMMLVIPMLTTNLKEDVVSSAENRVLAQYPKLYQEDGTRNSDFNEEFENWFNDNIGLRSYMVTTNAKIQYYLFDVLANNSDMYLGPKGELNYATSDMLVDYQHLNLKSEEELGLLEEGYQFMDTYLKEKGIQLYYFQCWDKHSIYPEQFPDIVKQYGEKSKTDQIVETLNDKTSVHVVSPKEQLIKGKDEYQTYSVWGDPTHWTDRGAYIGYNMLMDEINENNNGMYKVLQESDYNITVDDIGSTLFGGIHEECMCEKFEIKKPRASLTNEKLSLLADDERHRFFTNNYAKNKTRILVLGDSYLGGFLIDDLAESFYETMLIWGDHTYIFKQLIETYSPDIVIVENAERCDRTEGFVDMALKIKAKPE